METKPLAHADRGSRSASAGCIIITRDAHAVKENGKKDSAPFSADDSLDAIAARPMRRSGKNGISPETHVFGDADSRLTYDMLRGEVDEVDTEKQRIGIETIIQSFLPSKERYRTTGSKTPFQVGKFEQGRLGVSEVLYVARWNDSTKRENVHFNSETYYHAQLTYASSNIGQTLIMAFHEEKQMVFMRFMVNTPNGNKYPVKDILFLFNGDARLSIKLIPPINKELPYGDGGPREIHTDGHVGSLETVLTEPNISKIKNTLKQEIRRYVDFEEKSHDATLLYLRYAFPQTWYIQPPRNVEGDFNLDGQVDHLKHLTQRVCQLYHTKDSLLSVAVALARETETPLDYATYSNEKAKRLILEKIEAATGDITLELDRLLFVVALLSLYVGSLFQAVIEQKRDGEILKKATDAVKSMYLKRQPYDNGADDITESNLKLFGHFLTIHLMERTSVGIVSKFSAPPLQPRKKQLTHDATGKGTVTIHDSVDPVDPSMILCRLKGVHSTASKHTTGFTWANTITAVMHKKSHFHLTEYIADRDVYDGLKLFEKYSIFQELPDTFTESRIATPAQLSFRHSIPVKCDAFMVFDIVIDSPCKKLQGIAPDPDA